MGESMKMGVATEVAAGSLQRCRVCLGALTKLMAIRPLHLFPHRSLRHLHRPLLLCAALQSPTEGIADSMGSMKMGVATEVAAGGLQRCRVCLGALTKLMAIRPLHLLPHRSLRHLHPPLLLCAALQSPTEGIADSRGSMKMGVATEVAAGSPQRCRVCLGALTKLMAVRHRHQLLLATNAMCLRIRGRIVDI